VQANNEYIEPINPHPDEFENADLINSTCVEYMSSDSNRLTTPNATDDLNVRDIFKSKVELQQAIN